MNSTARTLLISLMMLNKTTEFQRKILPIASSAIKYTVDKISYSFLKKYLLRGGGKSLERDPASSKIKEKVLGALFGEKSLQRCF